MTPITLAFQDLAPAAQETLSSSGIAAEQLDLAGRAKNTGGKERLEPELLRDRLGLSNQLASLGEAPSHRLEISPRPQHRHLEPDASAPHCLDPRDIRARG